jgi:mono/diheme cytochrome c family protein
MKTNAFALISVVFILEIFLAGCGNSKKNNQNGQSSTTPAVAVSPTASPLSDDTRKSLAPIPSRASLCLPLDAVAKIPGRKIADKAALPQMTFEALKNKLAENCANCHAAPESANKVAFLFEHSGKKIIHEGVEKTFVGLSDEDLALRIRASLLRLPGVTPMPPGDLSAERMQSMQELGSQVESWLEAGRPNGIFNLQTSGAESESQTYTTLPEDMTELGDCLPVPEVLGHDFELDQSVEAWTTLPSSLKETDLFSFDPLALAKRGTFSYNVEYPLWADDAQKTRHIHVPSGKNAEGKLVRQSIAFDKETKQFLIPNNTRFYKTFFKAVKQTDGATRYRRIETRVIVSRQAPLKPLFGVYKWNEKEDSAILLTAPYRDGTPWKDETLRIVIDETSGHERTYPLPGRERCVQCHQGDKSFNLGFSALQINRRNVGESGRNLPVGKDELSQVNRLVQYGILAPDIVASELPKLEESGTEKPRNAHEIRAQGYMIGNCAHCHSPEGYAIKEGKVTLELDAGKIFGFDVKRGPASLPRERFVDKDGDLSFSYLYKRISDTGANNALMPMHVAGSPDCRMLELTAKWIKSIKDPDAAEGLPFECKKQEDVKWVPYDPTVSLSFLPRRIDWNEPSGMSALYRDLEFKEGLKLISETVFPVGWWRKKPECRFEGGTPPATPPKWFTDASSTKPWALVYSATPGQMLYTATCMQCHGEKGDGKGPIGQKIFNLSAGKVEVADFMKGLFGKRNDNLKLFDSTKSNGTSANLAGNYLIWMAMEGTKVTFPDDPEIRNFLGPHKAQMLKTIRDRCSWLLPHSSKVIRETDFEYQATRSICLFENELPTDPSSQAYLDLSFLEDGTTPANPAVQNAWLDKAAFNAGWVIFDFLRRVSDTETWPPLKNECEKVPALTR